MNNPPLENVFISVGANIEPETNIFNGLTLLAKSQRVTGVSTFYRTPAIDRPAQPGYLNGIIAIETLLLPVRLRDFLHEIEHAMGRERTGDPFAARTLDLDILTYGNAIVSVEGLEIPDPEIRKRPFLAAGLLELAPQLRLPGDSESLAAQLPASSVDALESVPEFTARLKEALLHES